MPSIPMETVTLVVNLVQLSFQIDAHIGSVNDLAFAHPDKQFCVITCGEDKTIKVWVFIASP